MSSIGLSQSGGQFTYNGWPVFISATDCETLAADTRFDFAAMLDQFVAHGFNKIRLWAHCWLGVWTGPPEAFLRPWKRIDGPTGAWSEVRFDLDAWDDAYWARLHAFCAAALERDFIVEISIFAEWVKDFGPFSVRGIPSGQWWRDELFRPEWNRRFNVNEAFTTNSAGHFWPEFYDLNHPERSRSGKTLRDYQQAYLDKMLAEVDGFPNVYYEFYNEFPPFPQNDDHDAGIHSGAAWQNHWAAYLKQHSRRLVGVAAHQIGRYHGENVGVEHFLDKPFIDVLNFHWFSDDPRKVAWATRPLLGHGKVIANNEGTWHGVTGDALPNDDWANRETRCVWGAFMAGTHYSLTEFPPDVGCDRWLLTAERFRTLRVIAESMEFEKLAATDAAGSSFDGLIGGGPATYWRLKADVGTAYLAYFWGPATQDRALLTLPAGTFECTWFDPRNGAELLRQTVTGAPFLVLPAPEKTTWHPDAGLALRIVRTGS